MIEDAADDDLIDPAELARFDRQLRYFSDIGRGELAPSECQRRLREAKVAILGVGGLGGWAAWALTSCGIGEMWMIDGDRVEISNLNRQILYTEGRPRAAQGRGGGGAAARLQPGGADHRDGAAAWAARSRSPTSSPAPTSSSTPPTGPPTTSSAGATDACFEAGIPYITMSHFPPVARVGPLYVPGVTGCFACQEIA